MDGIFKFSIFFIGLGIPENIFGYCYYYCCKFSAFAFYALFLLEDGSDNIICWWWIFFSSLINYIGYIFSILLILLLLLLPYSLSDCTSLGVGTFGNNFDFISIFSDLTSFFTK